MITSMKMKDVITDNDVAYFEWERQHGVSDTLEDTAGRLLATVAPLAAGNRAALGIALISAGFSLIRVQFGREVEVVVRNFFAEGGDAWLVKR